MRVEVVVDSSSWIRALDSALLPALVGWLQETHSILCVPLE